MRQHLLGTSTLAAAAIIAPSAMAMPIQSKSELGTPILTASMVAQFEAGIASNDDSAASADMRDGGFVNGRFAEIFFNGELTADNGLVYGAKIHLSTSGGGFATSAGGAQSSGFPGREYIYLSGGWGSMEFGNWIGADSGLNLCLTCNTYAGYGGLDTPWKSYIQNPNANYRNGSVNPHWFDQSAKVTYYTPVVAGIQAGVSYTSTQKGFFGPDNNQTADNDGMYKDIIGFGLQWNGDFNGVGVGLSAVGATSDGSLTYNTASDTLDARSIDAVKGLGYYELGAVIRYAGFQFGGSYWDSGSGGASRMRDYGYERDGWTLDGAYFFGPFSIELQYAQSHTSSSNRLLSHAAAVNHLATGAVSVAYEVAPSDMTEQYDVDMWAVSFGYSVAPGLKWYAEVVGADFEHTANQNAIAAGVPGADATNLENSAVAAISGLVLSF